MTIQFPADHNEGLEENPGGDDTQSAEHHDDTAQQSVLSPIADDEVPDFAPAQPTDGREVGDWKTRYKDKSARRRIRLEAAYLFTCLLTCAAGIVLTAIDVPQRLLNLTLPDWDRLSPFALSWLGGASGGSLFATKWLYHTVAKGIWNWDRFLWRFFTPILSAGAAFAVVTLSAGGVIPLFGSDLVRTDAGALGVSLLIGYFSDRTFSRLERLADEHLGPVRRSSDSHSEHSGGS